MMRVAQLNRDVVCAPAKSPSDNLFVNVKCVCNRQCKMVVDIVRPQTDA
jgi:hypothetical protein